MMQLSLYNTLSGKKDLFIPLNPDRVTMYVCGPTVYDRPHLGNARSVVVYDVLYRILQHIYGNKQVIYARNITDVDDKINAAAIKNNETITSLTARVTGWFHDDMQALQCLPPTLEPRATEHITHIIDLIQAIIRNGYAYVSEGHVLFDVTAMQQHPNAHYHYGKLSGRDSESLLAGARIDVASYKKDAADFVLWKPADAEDDTSSVFDSPWGKGRPGWHIECSAMSATHLGNDFDIHGGGADLKFPHHENEIAQSCAAHPENVYARYWVHNGFLMVNGEKMSKSLGNFITVRDLLDTSMHGEVIRYALLATHYRKPLDFNDKLIADAKTTLDGFYRILQTIPQEVIEQYDTEYAALPAGFMQALCDDINTPAALAELHALAKAVSSGTNAESFYSAAKFLGFFSVSAQTWTQGSANISWVEEKIAERDQAKQAKDWKTADAIRTELLAGGIILEDTPNGTTWRKA